MSMTDGAQASVREFELPTPAHPRLLLAQDLGLSGAALDRAERARRNSGQPLAVALSLLGLATEDRIADACAERYGATVWSSLHPIEVVQTPNLSPRFLQDSYALAMADETGNLCLGLVDPGDETIIAALRFAMGTDVPLRTVTLSAWRATQMPGFDLPHGADRPSPPPSAPSTWLDDTQRLKDIARDAPVVRIAEQILERAFLTHASDIHVEQKLDHTRVRFRMDGVLHDQEELALETGPALIARIKVLSDLDVAERRAPQDGRTTISVRGAPVDVRISTTPTVFGESLVVRLLTRRGMDYDLTRLGLRFDVSEGLTRLLGRTHGLLLVTGPTGSGKTTTLYAALRKLATTRNKILTIEDPVEYVFEDILQSQVNEAAGFTFATALRSFLRHDPDVILVGEIRDAETARLAVQASLTGHLVLATVHTNDAATTPSRLIDMGVERYLLGDAMIGVMAQRLVGQVCTVCRSTTPLSEQERAELEDSQHDIHVETVTRAVGCGVCQGSGRKGRRAVTELMICDQDVSEAIGTGGSAATLRELCGRQSGYATLRRDALEQSIAGHLDWTDAWRVAER